MPEPRLPRYTLCRQTVTLYHPDPVAQTVARTVLHGVFWDCRRRAGQEKTGTQGASAFLLIIPQKAARFGEAYTLAANDRVLQGEGPAVAYADWPGFVPAAVPGLCVVRYVDPKTLAGVLCHVEAGGDWAAGSAGAAGLHG